MKLRIGGLGTCGGSRRHGSVLFTTEVCVRSSEHVFEGSFGHLYIVQYTVSKQLEVGSKFVSNRLRPVSKRPDSVPASPRFWQCGPSTVRSVLPQPRVKQHRCCSLEWSKISVYITMQDLKYLRFNF